MLHVRHCEGSDHSPEIEDVVLDLWSRYRSVTTLAPSTVADYLTTVRKIERFAAHRSVRPMHFGLISEETGLSGWLSAFHAWVAMDARERGCRRPDWAGAKAAKHVAAWIRSAAAEGTITPVVLPRRRAAVPVAPKVCLTVSEFGRLFRACDRLATPAGWRWPSPRADYWRAALLLGWLYGADTGLLFGPCGLTWASITRATECPDGGVGLRSAWGWIVWERAKLRGRFERALLYPLRWPLRAVLDRLAASSGTDRVIYRDHRPNDVLRDLVRLAGLRRKCVIREGTVIRGDSGQATATAAWSFKDLRKTAATDGGSAAAELLGHSVTTRHYVSHTVVRYRSVMARTVPWACYRGHWLRYLRRD